MISVTVPIRTISEANARDHWKKKARRVRQQRAAVEMVLRTKTSPVLFSRIQNELFDVGLVVTITRLGQRTLDDDNLRGAIKGPRDSIAKWLGVDDAHLMVEWRYAQERAPAKTYAVRIEIVAAQEVRKSA
jgi:hypothetical protein